MAAIRFSRPGLLSRHHHLLFTLIISITIILLSSLPTIDAQEECAAPASGCENGLWSKSLCECQCIAPFCPSTPGSACTVVGGNCVAKNHWAECTEGLDCPWWKSITAHNSCATGTLIPAGIFGVYASNKECCAAEFSQWDDCAANLEAEYVIAITLPPRQQPKYTNVPIKYSLSGLGDDVDMDEVNANMLEILKQILASLAEKYDGLDIGSIEENLLQALKYDGKAPPGVEELYYEIMLLEGDGKEYSDAILEGLEEMSDLISQHMKAEVNLGDFEHKVDLDPEVWEEEEEEEIAIDVIENEKYRVKFRLADVPEDLDMETLIGHIMSVYLSELQKSNTTDLDIIGIEGGNIMKNVVTNDEDGSMVVFLDVIVAPKSEDVKVGQVINQVLSREGFKNDVLIEIQSHTDTSTDLDLDWCIDEENDGAYAVCTKSSPWYSVFKLPLWLLITILVLSLLLFCCLWYCIAKYCIYRQEYRNDRNLLTYIETGKQFRKQPVKAATEDVTYKNYKKKRRQLTNKRTNFAGGSKRPSDPEEPPTYKTRQRYNQDKHHSSKHDKPRQNYPAIEQGPQPLMIESGPSHKKGKGGGRTPRQQYPELTNGEEQQHATPNNDRTRDRRPKPPKQPMLTNGNNNRRDTPPMDDRSWDEEDQDEQPQHLQITNDTNYQIDNMPSFVFNDDKGNNYKNGDDDDDGRLPPPQPRGPQDENNRNEMLAIEEGGWFVDEESVLTPSYGS